MQLLDNAGCFCPGEFLIYKCTVMGDLGGATVWTGSAFSCIGHEINLLHIQYESIEGAYGDCDDIVGRNVNTTDGNISTGYYISQLTAPISSDTAGKNIDCAYDDGTNLESVGQMTIPAPISNNNYRLVC